MIVDQRAGEVLFLPEGWHHATLNSGETLAVAAQARQLDELRAAAAERGQPFLGPSDPMAEFERIASNEIDVQWYRGHGGAGADFSEYVEKLRKLLASHAGAQ